MTKMENLRDDFINICTELRSIASGYMSVASDSSIQYAHGEQEKTREIFEATEQGTNQAVQELFAGWRSNIQAYSDNRDMPLEIFHAYFVQAWYSFLDNIFELILEQHFAGSKSYEIEPISVKFRSSEDTPANLADNIRQRVWESFSNRMSPDEKLKVIAKALNVSFPQALKRSIRKHVLVRNVFQHNRGRLRVRDLRYLQSEELKYPCTEGEEQGDYYNPDQIRDYRLKFYRVDDVVRIDAMVLDQIYYDLVEAAKQLVA